MKRKDQAKFRRGLRAFAAACEQLVSTFATLARALPLCKHCGTPFRCRYFLPTPELPGGAILCPRCKTDHDERHSLPDSPIIIAMKPKPTQQQAQVLQVLGDKELTPAQLRDEYKAQHGPQAWGALANAVSECIFAGWIELIEPQGTSFYRTTNAGAELFNVCSCCLTGDDVRFFLPTPALPGGDFLCPECKADHDDWISKPLALNE